MTEGGPGEPPGPVVSVCIPTLDGGPWLRQAVLSALGQTHTDLVVIVAGNDPAIQSLADLDDPRLRLVVNPEPKSLSENHCQLIDRSDGTYLAFLHDDDWWEPTYLETALAVLEACPDVGFTLMGVEEVGTRGERLGARPSRVPPGVLDDPLASFLRRDFMLLLPSTAVFRRLALVDNRRPWPDTITGDASMNVDLVVAGWNVVYIDQALVHYRIHDAQVGVRAVAQREGLVALWSGYRFDDPRHERLRVRRLASVHVALAGAHLREGAVTEARAEIAAARRTDASADVLRRTAVTALTWVSPVVPPLHRLWLRLRNPVRRRHAG